MWNILDHRLNGRSLKMSFFFFFLIKKHLVANPVPSSEFQEQFPTILLTDAFVFLSDCSRCNGSTLLNISSFRSILVALLMKVFFSEVFLWNLRKAHLTFTESAVIILGEGQAQLAWRPKLLWYQYLFFWFQYLGWIWIWLELVFN